MCNMCHIYGMNTITIRQLHAATGRYVRQAAREPFIVTDRGKQVAVLTALGQGEDIPPTFPRRLAADLPAVGLDSTELISADRDER